MIARWQVKAAACLLLAGAACGPERTVYLKQSSEISSVRSEQEFYELYDVKLQWLQGPFVGLAKSKENIAQFCFFKKGLAQPVKVEALDFKIYMKIHGHGGKDTYQLVQAVEGLENCYLGRKFYFTMSGPWEFNLKVTLAQETYAVEVPTEI